ncbi:TonB-dependent receptor [bacterium]|nr:TonB-dependent receptor [bacterium]
MEKIINHFLIKVILCISLFGIVTGFAQQVSRINGVVIDNKKQPLLYVNVFFIDNLEGTMSDKDGRFTINTNIYGDRNLHFSHIGYEQQEITVHIAPGELINVKIQLKKALIEMDMVTVSAESFTMADEEGQTLTSMDIVTTAGAAADIFRAIQTFPGVTQIDEGAGMYVRGGDVSETVVLLDQATLIHPYRYESDTGGYFGMINPFLLSGTFFSSGGFPAKYGNALSGILAMESLGFPDNSSVDFGLGLAAVSLGGSYILIPEKLGIRFSGNYSYTKYLFRVNGGEEKFKKVPISWDGNLSLIYKYSERGQLKLFNYINQDDIGILYKSPVYAGTFISGNESLLNNLQWQHLFPSKLLLKSSFSKNEFIQNIELGNMDLSTTDGMIKWRTDASFPIRKKVKLGTGFELDKLKTTIAGSVPDDPNDFRPGAAINTFSTDYLTKHIGAYIDGEISISPRLFTICGIRLDYLTNGDEITIDPRFSIGYRLTENQIAKFATGLYHQYPLARYSDETIGNPNLNSQEAIHYIVGYEYKSDITNVKIETYRKNYNDLLLSDSTQNYINDGYGNAIGFDFFAKGNLPIISGWISYSYLIAKRK